MTLAVLSWIAGMPRLKSLLIQPHWTCLEWEPKLLSFPPHSFAALRSLTVIFQRMENVKTLWSMPLVSNLACARVVFNHWIRYDSLEVSQFFDILVKSSPNLTTFSMAAKYEAHFFPTKLPIEIASILSSLSLGSLQLGGIQLVSSAGDVFGRIAQWWPLLRALDFDLHDHVATFDDLAIILRSFLWLDYLHLQLKPALPPGKNVALPSVQYFSPHLAFQSHLRHLYSLSQAEKNDFA